VNRKTKPLLIGLAGKSGSGKNTAADYLTRVHGYRQLAFADPLKAVVQRAFHFTAEQMLFRKEIEDPRCGKSPRWCLQHFGTVFREVWPEIWIWNLRQNLLDRLALFGEQRIVVTDVRFRNEAEALQRLGAVLIRLTRAGAPEPNGIPDHISERDLDDWAGWEPDRTYLIDNTGHLEGLYACLEKVLHLAADKAESQATTG
jgi:hypothetical protein